MASRFFARRAFNAATKCSTARSLGLRFKSSAVARPIQSEPEVFVSPRQPGPTAPAPLTNRAPSETSFVGMTGGQIFHEMMLQHDVKHIFGYPGGAILPVYDAIYNSKQFQLVLPRHEQGAGHMAEGYARATGKPGVVLVTSGPGATNVITPMQDALSDGIPLVVFTGQVPTTAIGTDAFQEADIIGISRSCTKWNVMVKDVKELPRRINEAFTIATSGRPGPVLVDLPKDVTAAILNQHIPSNPKIPMRTLSNKEEGRCQRNQGAMKRAIEMINNAKRPVIYCGNGLLNSPEGPELLKQLSHHGDIPVTTTLQALGAFDEEDPRSLHMLGMHGSAYANLAMQHADVVIALGARFDDRVTGNLKFFAPSARKAEAEGRGGLIQFEILPKNINKVVSVTEAVEGDVTESLRQIMPHISKGQRTEWFSRIAEWKHKYPFTYGGPVGYHGLMKPQFVLDEFNRQTAQIKDKVLLTTGVGQHQMWAAQYYRWRHPRTMISSGGLGTMGFGLPAAIGAKVAQPDKIVVDVDGDASFSMTAMELATAAQYGVGVKVLLLNNDFQGMVKQWQDLFYEERYSSTRMFNPDFVKLSEAMGCRGMRCSAPEDLPSIMADFLSHPGPVVLEAKVDRAEHVYPMVPAGKALHEMVLSDSLQLNEKFNFV
ncbi:Acetolactate synthase, mitochondrial [Entomophthora muscae]|uniref:Acetolactate synthase, mitochondrial n=1 Tax=Entomophthora muscae TaxID=34485 RepID=A0ACC2RM86_9FUNG|nr:Acetolactate synthase, mitochondrial [Entomophthora muscae]